MRQIKNISILIVILTSMAVAGTVDKARFGAVSGCLTDSRTGRPVIDAWVAVLETNQGVRTDSTGCFVIPDLKPGSYNLVISHSDYGTVQGLAELVVQIGRAQTATVQISLSPRAETEEYKGRKESPAATGRSEAGSLSDERLRQSTALNGPAIIGMPSHDKDAFGSNRLDQVDRGVEYLQKVKRQPNSPPYPAEEDYVWQPRDMYFRDYGTNGFIDTRSDRYSTFATDVDDASYTLVRRYLQEGNQVPSDAVRVEEFINHFDYGYNVPDGEIFRVFTELTDSPFESGRRIMKVAIKGRELDRRQRKPLNLTFVIDVSGSMSQGNRFQLVKESLRTLVRQLDRDDRVGIVAYGSNAYAVLEPVSADRQRVIFDAIERLSPGGSTYAEAGIRLGYEMANRQFVSGHSNLVILCSDGVANVGRTSPDAIMSQIDHWAKKGISLNTYGYGMGNYNDVLLEQLAQKGNGRYGYINDRDELRQTFVTDFVSNVEVLARDVKVQVEFNPEVVQSYRLLGYENREVPDYRFRDDRQDGGEVGAGHEVTALYELDLRSRGLGPNSRLATVFVRWKNAGETRVAELSREVTWGRDRQLFDRSRPELRLAMVVGRFAEMLKGTRFAAETSYRELYRIAESLRRELPGEQTTELLELIQRAGNLYDWQADDYNYRGKRVYGNYKR